MSVMHWLLTYLTSFIVFLVLDGAWIGLVAGKQYRQTAGHVLRSKPQLTPVIIFYVLYVAGTLLFATVPMQQHFTGHYTSPLLIGKVFAWGGLLGIFAYSTFSLTNQTIIAGWKAKLVVADMAWGGVITGIVSVVGFATIRALS